MLRGHFQAMSTVESRIKEPKFILDSLNRFLIKWLLCSASEVLIDSTHVTHINTAFQHKDSDEFLRILKNS